MNYNRSSGGSGELFDLRPLEVGHARVQKRRWRVGGVDLLQQSLFAILQLRLSAASSLYAGRDSRAKISRADWPGSSGSP